MGKKYANLVTHASYGVYIIYYNYNYIILLLYYNIICFLITA